MLPLEGYGNYEDANKTLQIRFLDYFRDVVDAAVDHFIDITIEENHNFKKQPIADLIYFEVIRELSARNEIKSLKDIVRIDFFSRHESSISELLKETFDVESSLNHFKIYNTDLQDDIYALHYRGDLTYVVHKLILLHSTELLGDFEDRDIIVIVKCKNKLNNGYNEYYFRSSVFTNWIRLSKDLKVTIPTTINNGDLIV